MPNLFGKRMNRKEIEKYVGNIEQIGGMRRSELLNGMGRGVEVIDVKTGSGLTFTVTPGRSLDILDVALNGCPFAWMSPAGPVHPSYSDWRNYEFLRTFSGGFMTTCGMSNIGNATVDNGEELGLHGRVPTLPARDVNTSCRWIGNEYIMSIEGEVREYALYGAYFRMNRRYTAWLGENRILVEDVVENASREKVPHQILYHLNLSYPLMDEGTETRIKAKSTLSRETGMEADPKMWAKFPAPNAKIPQECYFHNPIADSRGMARTAVINPKANGGEGLAVLIKQSKDTLPWTMQWRYPSTGDYIQGIEPANSWVIGRDKDREAGRLVFMKPGEVRAYTLEFEFFTGKKAISQIQI